jgi:single-strand DNA-binding protein
MLKLQLIGNLGQDAVVNNVGGKNVINFSVAHTEKYKNSENNEVSKTTWVSCAYWSEKVNLANYLKKGTQVYLEGKPEAKTYSNSAKEVVPQLSVRVSGLQLLSGSKSEKEEEFPF